MDHTLRVHRYRSPIPSSRNPFARQREIHGLGFRVGQRLFNRPTFANRIHPDEHRCADLPTPARQDCLASREIVRAIASRKR